MNATGPVLPLKGIVTSGGMLIVGALLVTVLTLNAVEVDSPCSSVTVSVTVVAPTAPGVPLTVTVRFAPDPPRTAVNAGLDDTADTVSALTAL